MIRPNEAPKSAYPKIESLKIRAPKNESPKNESPKNASLKSEAPNRRRSVRSKAGRALLSAAAILLAGLLASASVAPAAARAASAEAASAEAASADAVPADSFGELKAALEGAEAGATVVVGGREIDLAGGRVDVGAAGVTLAGGPAGFDLAEAVRAAARDFLADPANVSPASPAASEAFSDLIAQILSNLPGTTIRNSAAKAVTSAQASKGEHSGISAPKGGFSLENLTFKGTAAAAVRAAGATGASHVYMGLVGPDLTRLETGGPYPGMGVIRNVAFVGNVAHADSNVNVEGNTVFFTRRRYEPGGGFRRRDDPNPSPEASSALEGMSGVVFQGNETLVGAPEAEGDTGNRTYSGAGLGWPEVGLIEASLFAGNSTSGGHHSFGGAVHLQSAGRIIDSIFVGNSNNGDHDAYGGALMAAEIGELAGSVFIGNSARGFTNEFVPGTAVSGGAVFARRLAGIEGSYFGHNRAVSDVSGSAPEKEAFGGAVSSGFIGKVERSVFVGNAVEVRPAGGEAGGGALHLAADTGGAAPFTRTVVTDSLFSGNSVEAPDGEASGGAVNVAVKGPGDYALTLAATSGSSTTFAGNLAGGEPNAIAFGGGADLGTSLVVAPARGGTVRLADPVSVGLDNPAPAAGFKLVRTGGGEFFWGGRNRILVAGGTAVVDLGGGGRDDTGEYAGAAPGPAAGAETGQEAGPATGQEAGREAGQDAGTDDPGRAVEAATGQEAGIRTGPTTLMAGFNLSTAEGGKTVEVALGGSDLRLVVDDPDRPFFTGVHFASLPAAISVSGLPAGDGGDEASFVFASDSTGLAGLTVASVNPDGTTTRVSIDSSGKGTVSCSPK